MSEIVKKNPAIFGVIDTMKMLCKEKYSQFHKEYLNTYIDYTFASLEESLTLKEKEKMFFDILFFCHFNILL